MTSSDPIFSSYVALINSLSHEMKLNLLLVLAESLQADKSKHSAGEPTTVVNEKFSYLHLFGSWQSDETADEIIEDIYSARKDRPAPELF